MPDSSGLPLIADLAAMRDAVVAAGGDPCQVNPKIPVDLVVDHSVIVDVAGRADAMQCNLEAEFARNEERYRLVRWAENAFRNLRVIPPGNGICHQINLERLAKVVWSETGGGRNRVYPDTLVGMDSHTPMVNSLCVLGWGVGGIEAATAMLGEPIGVPVPKVIGCRLVGTLRPDVSTTDLGLTITQRLRAKGVVGAFVEFCGSGVSSLSVPQRATLSNMAPEYGATTGLFAIDRQTLDYLETTGRSAPHISLVEAYAKAQGLWRDASTAEAVYDDLIELDLNEVEISAAGPKRPQDRVALSQVPATFADLLRQAPSARSTKGELRDGDVVLAAITSCTNTSNPSVMIAAGLLARNAVARGLRVKPWVKTSLAPGSRVVADYLRAAGLQDSLDRLGFNIVGFGCTSCMGNSGPLALAVTQDLIQNKQMAVAVLSGNRNFEGRIHNLAQANYLVSPALVVAYALAGSITIDLSQDPLGPDKAGRLVYLADIQPDPAEIDRLIALHVGQDAYVKRYQYGFEQPDLWRRLSGADGEVFSWEESSTYIRQPPFLRGIDHHILPPEDIIGARPLLIVGDSITTDHISPVSQITAASSAGQYLRELGVADNELGSFMARRVNHDVMLRGTFTHPRLQNEMLAAKRGGLTRLMPEDIEMTITDAASRYRQAGIPVIVIAGAEYGTGSSRDWAAKGTWMLGIRAVLAESFERIHRSNLVGMGILPLRFPDGVSRSTLNLDGSECFDIQGIADGIEPGSTISITIRRLDGSMQEIQMRVSIDTLREAEWYRHGGIYPLTLRELIHDPTCRAEADGVRP